MKLLNIATILIGLWFIVYSILFAIGILSVTYIFTTFLLAIWGIAFVVTGLLGVIDRG